MIEDLDTEFKKYKATYFIGLKLKSSKSRRNKEEERKAKRRKVVAQEEESVYNIYVTGGTLVDGEHDPEINGFPQIENIDLGTLPIFTSLADKACLRDLLSSNCFIGEAAESVQEFSK